MKKILLVILVVCLLPVFAAEPVFAVNPEPAVEVPGVKIIMNGKRTPFKDVPICIGQNTLLPLRELLVNLGVPDDDQHILYNNLEKSVTVNKDQTQIVLTVDNTTAMVNGGPVKLNVAPVGYEKNQRIYIPLRFVAEALGKKVVWDGSINAILITDMDQFERNRQILDQANAAMLKVNQCRQTMEMESTVKSGLVAMRYGMNTTAQINKAEKTMYTEMKISLFGLEMTTSAYYVNQSSYILGPLNPSWLKKTYIQSEYDHLFAGQSQAVTPDVSETLCAGLAIGQGSGADEIVLKGDVYLKDLLGTIEDSQEAVNTVDSDYKTEPDCYYTEISVDRATYYINRITMEIGSTVTSGKETTTTDMNVKIQYSEYNNGVQIIVPDVVLNSAAEAKNPAQ